MNFETRKVLNVQTQNTLKRYIEIKSTNDSLEYIEFFPFQALRHEFLDTKII